MPSSCYVSGAAIKVLFARPPGLAYLYGSFEKGEIERKEKQRREKIKVRNVCNHSSREGGNE